MAGSPSVLFLCPAEAESGEPGSRPAFFSDLNLDQLVEAATLTWSEYDLISFFHRPLRSVEAIRFRHEVLRDLCVEKVAVPVAQFSEAMRVMRRRLARANAMRYRHQQQRWFLDAVATFCGAVRDLADGLNDATIRSRGLAAVRDHLIRYIGSDEFRSLLADVTDLQTRLSDIHYCLRIRGGTIRVRHYRDEPDYTAELESTFEKFHQGAVEDQRVKFADLEEMNHVEAQILDRVAQLFPDVFLALERFVDSHDGFLDGTVARFDREVQFYRAYQAYIEPVRAAGLPFCYPQVSGSKSESADATFDLPLARRLTAEGGRVVCNDFSVSGPERIIVVTGPNQGGKTTFARTFGQLHYLACLGLPVPGRQATLFLADTLYTLFEREEDSHDLGGKLEDDLRRIRAILTTATPDSVIILNELFASTTLSDAVLLATRLMTRLDRLDALSVFVTFLDELASFSDKVMSMTSTVVPGDPATRTFRIVRRPADGLAYAVAIAEKYGLTYQRLAERLAR